MKKIIHLSDTHLGHKDMSRRMEGIVTRIIFTKEKASDYIIVHTGDVVEDATQEDSYVEALVHFKRLTDAGFTVLIVPGNHDHGTGSIGFREYIDKFKIHFYGTNNVTYPIKTIIDNIAFLGLNSMAEEVHWYDRLFAEGELGNIQLGLLKDMLNTDDVKSCKYRVVYLHHHPFHPRLFHQLKDSDELGEVLKRSNISALLFGHNHDGKVWSGRWGIPRIYDAGSSTGKKGKPSPHRVIDLSREPAFDYDAQLDLR